MKSSAAIRMAGSKKSTKFALGDDNDFDSRESSIHACSKERYRSSGTGVGHATITTITSSNENTPERAHPLALHSLGHSLENLTSTSSYPKFDSIVIAAAILHDCKNGAIDTSTAKMTLGPGLPT